MNWKEIKVTSDERGFHVNQQALFNKQFQHVMKFHEPGIAPVCDESGWYHILTDGSALYQQRYKRAYGYYFNRASVVDDNENYFHISENGERVYQESYQWTGNFQENLCTVRNDRGLYHHINPDGTKAYEEEYRYAGDFREESACVMMTNGLSTHIKANGELLHGRFFADVGVYHKGIATAKDQGGWFHIDRNGDPQYEDRFAMAEPYYNGTALVVGLDGGRVLIDGVGLKIVTVMDMVK